MIQFRSNGTQAGVRLKHLFWCGAGWLAGLLTLPALAGTNTMTRVGPYGGNVHKVAYHPTNSSIVYAATNGGFYRSTNGGASWQLVNDAFSLPPLDVAVNAAQPNRVFVVVQAEGVSSSEDAGAMLTPLNSSSEFDSNATEIEYSADGSVLYLSTGSLSTGSRVYRSLDHGNSWLPGGNIPITDLLASQLVVDPTDPSRLYMIGLTGTGFVGEGFQSADAGVTWQPWRVPNAMVNDLAVANTSPLRIWAATSTGTWFTEDGGSTWSNSLPTYSLTVTVDPTNPTVVYAGLSRGLRRTGDNGANWSDIQDDPAVGLITSVAIDHASPDRVLLAGQAGVASSDDSGAHWTSRNEGIDALSSYELASSAGSARIYINARLDGLYAVSTNDGSSSALNNRQLSQLTNQPGFEGLGLLVVPGTPDRLFVGARNGIARSLDAGASWHLVGAALNFQPRALASASADGSRLLTATQTGLWYSTDGGNSWAQGPVVDAIDFTRMMSAPSNPLVIYLGGRQPSTSRYVILRSPDGGNTWTSHEFPGNGVMSMAVDPRDEQTLYAGGSGELLKSTDGGQTWTELLVPPSRGFPSRAIAIDPQNPDIVYTAGIGRIARSVDAGASWQVLSFDTVRFPDVRALAVDPQRSHSLYVAIDGRGVREFSVEPDLQISATVPNAPTAQGTAATYSYRMRNAGPFDATNVRARIQLPADAANVTATSADASCTIAGSIVTCTKAILRTDTGADIAITATQPNAGTFTVVGTVAGDQPDAAVADNTVTSNVEIRGISNEPPQGSGNNGGGAGGGGGGGNTSPFMLAALLVLSWMRAASAAGARRG